MTIEITVEHHSDGTDTASCVYAGDTYAAKSAKGAIFALCRRLVDAGCGDEPWKVPGRLSGRVWRSAALTCTEAQGTPRAVPWTPHPHATVSLALAAVLADAAARRAARRAERR